jgi:thiamine monophosphate kinase
VAVSGSTVVYVCGFSFTISPSATSADTAAFEYGTGAACTSPTLLTGTFGNGDLTSSAPVTLIHYGGAGQTVFKSAASAGICIVTTGTTVNAQGVITFVQQ